MRVPQPDIIEHFGNADAVPQPPERCLSRKAGIVRCCPGSAECWKTWITRRGAHRAPAAASLQSNTHNPIQTKSTAKAITHSPLRSVCLCGF